MVPKSKKPGINFSHCLERSFCILLPPSLWRNTHQFVVRRSNVDIGSGRLRGGFTMLHLPRPQASLLQNQPKQLPVAFFSSKLAIVASNHENIWQLQPSKRVMRWCSIESSVEKLQKKKYHNGIRCL